MRKNGRNLMGLLLIVLALYLLDNSRLKKYIGYEKVKEYISKDMDVFGLAKGLFGDDIISFYKVDSEVSSTITSTKKHGNGMIVFQLEDYLYSPVFGSVVNIKYQDNYYSITISTLKGNILISNIISLNLSLYQKIDVGTFIGMVDGFYYYEEI